MKSVFRNMAICLLIAAITALSFSSSVQASESEKQDPLSGFDYKTILTKYNNKETGFNYNDGMLLKDSNSLSTDLAKASVAMATEAYSKSTNHIAEVFKSMGYEEVDGYDVYSGTYKTAYSFNYDRLETMEDNDFVGYSIGKKPVSWDGQDYIIYCVPVRGTHGELDWVSDFNLGRKDDGSQDHKGFYMAAEEILGNLNYVLTNDNYDSSHTILWTTGHSRGAAVANIVAGELTDQYYGGSGTTLVDANHIFAYTFACPSVSKIANTDYVNIYNFNNNGDLIPVVPLERWGYHRYGQTVTLSYTSEVFDNFKQQFNTLYGSEFAGALDTAAAQDLLYEMIPSDQEFYSFESICAFTMIAWVLDNNSYGTNASLYDILTHVFSTYAIEGAGVETLLNSLIGKAGLPVFLLKYSAEIGDDLVFLESFHDGGLSFSEWHSLHKDRINTIENDYQVSIDSENELIEAVEEISSLTALADNKDRIAEILRVFVGANGNPLKAVTHGHTGETYIAWINSMFYGYNGWINNEKVESVTVPAIVNSIGYSCFKDCSSLESVGILDPANVNYIGPGAFSGNAALSQMELLQGDTYFIGGDAFLDCMGLTGEIVISDTIRTIGFSAFRNCSGITKVTIPVDWLCGYYRDSSFMPSFSGCTGVKEIHYTKGNTGRMPDHSGKYNMSAEELLQYNYFTYSLEYCVRDSLEIVTFDEGITKIGAYAFCNSPSCTKLQKVVLPESLEEIGENAFSGCTALSDIKLPQKLSKIGISCFDGCSSIEKTCEEFGLPASLTSIPGGAFRDCTGLTGELIIPDTATGIVYSAFQNCSGITKVTIPVDWHCGYYRDSSVMPSFSGCTGVKEIHYTKGSTGRMPDHSGKYNMSAEELLQYNYFTYSLEYCVRDSLEIVTFDEGITKIGEYAFCNYPSCTKLQTVVLPKSLEEIGANAFNGCSSAMIYSFKDSYAESYADTYSIPFIPLCYPLFEEVPEEIEKGASAQLGVKVYVSWDNVTEEAQWSISGNENDETTITEDGLLTVARKETAESITVTASYGEYSNSVTIRIIPKQGIIDVESIVINPAEAEMRTSKTILEKPYTITEASTLQLTALIEPEDATNQDVTWISSNPEVAEVDENGLVTALTYGETVITATTEDGGLTANCRIQTRYNDVAEPGYWFAPVYWAADHSITNGYANIYFGPEENCTREQMITFLYRTAGSPAVSGTVSFSDMKKGSYYYNAVLWAFENGITKGYSSGPYKGKFGVGLNVTREDTVTFIYRMAGKPTYSTTKSFKDVAKGKYYYDPVRWAAQNGITKGYSDGTFGVGKDVLRKDIVTFLYRYDNMSN